MASLGVVWSNRKSKRRHKNKVRPTVRVETMKGRLYPSRSVAASHSILLQVLPVASESRQTIVEMVKSLSTLHTDTVLHLVKEVVKKPHQIKGEQVQKHRCMERHLRFVICTFLESFFFFPIFLSIRSRHWSISPCCSSASPISRGMSKNIIQAQTKALYRSEKCSKNNPILKPSLLPYIVFQLRLCRKTLHLSSVCYGSLFSSTWPPLDISYSWGQFSS